MDSIEQARYQDIVKLVNRTDEPLEFMFDSRLFIVKPGKALNIPRFIAEYGITKYHTKADPLTGLPVESLMGIEDDPDWPTEKVKGANVEETLEADKLGQGETIMGPPRKMRKISLRGAKEKFGGDE
ncbi:MAG TPA: hypothetical protein VN604_06405 [Nitrospirota bacterium]|nr:hypothetical protein [Nitrospirota bacterium]